MEYGTFERKLNNNRVMKSSVVQSAVPVVMDDGGIGFPKKPLFDHRTLPMTQRYCFSCGSQSFHYQSIPVVVVASLPVGWNGINPLLIGSPIGSLLDL